MNLQLGVLGVCIYQLHIAGFESPGHRVARTSPTTRNQRVARAVNARTG